MNDQEQLNPLRIWREWMVKSEKMWSERLTDMMGDERFAKGMGRYAQEALHTHRMFSEAMAQYLSNLNIPSRADILDLGDRLSEIEDTLAAIQVELREHRATLAALAPGGAGKTTGVKKPARTKRAPKNED